MSTSPHPTGFAPLTRSGAVASLLLAATVSLAAQQMPPITYTIRVPDPASHLARIEARIPARGKDTLDLMMPVWSPGFYRVEDYAGKVQDFAAIGRRGAPLAVAHPQPNRWRVATGGAREVTVTYTLLCASRSVTTNWVGDDLGVFNGSATYITLAERARRPHEVRLELPPQWTASATALARVRPGVANQYRADDYDTLNDSPIVAGSLSTHEFAVAGSRHVLVDAGNIAGWDGELAARNIRQFVRADSALWGSLPFRRYVFLNLFRPGGGGLEHLNSTLLTSRVSPDAPGGNLRWLNFVSHEYFHAFNVKRLRPVELGPFDYEHPPSTESLWISEGLTSYYGELLVARAGLGSPGDFLATLSSHIRSVQRSPGRLRQTLAQSSQQVWTAGTSGVGQDPATTVSYYDKGPIVGFLLDAHIRRSSRGARSLDDVMRQAYVKYSGARGFTHDEFVAVAESVAGHSLREFFRRAVFSTEELDYAEALEWFGLRFVTADPVREWQLEPLPEATPEQRAHLTALVAVTIGDR
jgi:predicted metalloprotease with PDZ domain